MPVTPPLALPVDVSSASPCRGMTCGICICDDSGRDAFCRRVGGSGDGEDGAAGGKCSWSQSGVGLTTERGACGGAHERAGQLSMGRPAREITPGVQWRRPADAFTTDPDVSPAYATLCETGTVKLAHRDRATRRGHSQSAEAPARRSRTDVRGVSRKRRDRAPLELPAPRAARGGRSRPCRRGRAEGVREGRELEWSRNDDIGYTVYLVEPGRERRGDRCGRRA